MSSPPADPAVRRLSSARAAMRAAKLDALLVTHVPNIRYLTGFSGSAGAVVLTEARCALVVDFRYGTAARALLAAGAAGTVELHEIDGPYDDAIAALLGREGMAVVGVEAQWLPVSRYNRLVSLLGGITPRPTPLVPTERLIERGRLIKDAAEISTLREAAARLSRVAHRLRDWAVPGRTEQEVAADIDAAMRRHGFERPAFETIVASGPRGALPHARPEGRVLAQGDGVVLDFGGVYDGYCVDLTRTLELGAWSPEFRHMFDAVAEAQAAAIAAVRPGVRASAIDGAARAVLERRGLGEAFGHGTGHGLGLEVHEEPRVARPSPGIPDPDEIGRAHV